MTEGIIVAVLALIGTLCGSYFSNRKTQALIEYRMKEVEGDIAANKKAAESLSDRTYQLEKRVSVVEADEARTNARLKKLEEGVHC